MKKSSGRKNHTIGRNTKEQHQRMEVIKELNKKYRQSQKEDRIVYVKERIYALNSRKIQEQILQENYNLVDVGVRVARRELSSFLYFLPIFYFLFLFLAPRIRVSSSIGHMAQRRFQKNDVILCADLMANTWLFRVGQKQLAQTMMIQYIKVNYSVQSFPSSSLM